MYMLAWSTGFRRGFKRATRKAPWLQDKKLCGPSALSGSNKSLTRSEPMIPQTEPPRREGREESLFACWVAHSNRSALVMDYSRQKSISLRRMSLSRSDVKF